MDEKLIIVKEIAKTADTEYLFDCFHISYRWSMAGGYLVPVEQFIKAVQVLEVHNIDIIY